MAFMKTAFSFLICLLFLGTTSFAQWESVSPYPGGATDGIASFEIDGKIYAGGGLGQQSFYELNPETGSWTEKAKIPGGVNRGWVIGFSINGKGYMGGGDKTGSFDVTNDFYRYDPSLDEWTQIADFGGGNRDGAFACSLNGKGYVFGGFNGTSAVSDVWEYDPDADSWTQKSNYPGGSAIFPAGFVANDKVYVGTGSPGGGGSSGSFYVYSPSTDSWKQKADFPSPRQAAVGFAVGSTGYIGGGQENYSATFTDFYQYDIWTDTWSKQPSLDFAPTASVAWSGACVVNNTVFMGTGADFEGGTLNFSDKYYKADITPLSIATTAQHDVEIYPNPSSGVVHIKSQNGGALGTIHIFNSTGELVLVSDGKSNVLSTSELATGIYSVRITVTGKATMVKPLVIHR